MEGDFFMFRFDKMEDNMTAFATGAFVITEPFVTAL